MGGREGPKGTALCAMEPMTVVCSFSFSFEGLASLSEADIGASCSQLDSAFHKAFSKKTYRLSLTCRDLRLLLIPTPFSKLCQG